jgi:hypothetical protein
MKQLGLGGVYKFPENSREAAIWEPSSCYHALASTVLAVATTRVEGT